MFTAAECSETNDGVIFIRKDDTHLNIIIYYVCVHDTTILYYLFAEYIINYYIIVVAVVVIGVRTGGAEGA